MRIFRKLSARMALAVVIVACCMMSARAESIYEVSRTDAEKKIENMLISAGEGEGFRVSLTGIPQNKLFLSGKPLTLEVDNFNYDMGSGKFSAKLRYMNGSELAGIRDVTGRFDRMISLPALKNRIGIGSIIREEDLTTVQIYSSKMRSEYASKPEELIGKSVSRGISSLRPVKLSEVREPDVIRKGDMITMIYRKGRIEIKTYGIAGSDGGMGEYITATNNKSGITVKGKVASNNSIIIEGLRDETDRTESEQANVNDAEIFAR